jgi:putative heme-binding domain-containing protein
MFHVNTVIGHLWHVIPGAHFKESWGGSRNPLVYERIGQHADHFHYDRGKGWQKSRHGAANDFGGGHCHIGTAIYQGTHLPEPFRDRLITWNTHGLRANVERLERQGSGYVGKHEPDVFHTSDKWFRGLEISVGPDGALYGLDWRDTGECHEFTGVHRSSGRVLRFSHGKPGKPVLMKSLAAALAQPNPWHYRQYCVQLPDVLSPETIGLLERTVQGKAAVSERLRALWLLYQRGAVEQSALLGLLADDNEHVRTWAVRLLSDHWQLDTLNGPLGKKTVDLEIAAKFAEAAQSEPSGLVRLAYASTLQRLPLKHRADLAVALARRAADAKDHNLPLMVWFGIMACADESPETLLRVAKATSWPGLLRWIARTQASDPERLSEVLAIALKEPGKAGPILLGAQQAYKGLAKAGKPDNWDRVAAAFATVPEVEELSHLFGTGRSVEEQMGIVNNGGMDLAVRQRALDALIKQRPDGLRQLCEKHVFTRGLTVTALRALGTFDDPVISERLTDHFRRFRRSDEKAAVMDLLSSRTVWANRLLETVEKGKIPRSAVSVYHARQIAALGDDALSKRLKTVWGELRASDAEKKKLTDELREKLTSEVLAKADLAAGRRVYQSVCASCHLLYGEGGKLGPDLTGSGRAQLDYLLENVVDPSAVVSAEYRMTNLMLKDGRTLSGVVAATSEKTLTLRQLTEEITLPRSAIKKRQDFSQSIMPEGLLTNLSDEQVRDLIAYLMHPRQVELK